MWAILRDEQRMAYQSFSDRLVYGFLENLEPTIRVGFRVWNQIVAITVWISIYRLKPSSKLKDVQQSSLNIIRSSEPTLKFIEAPQEELVRRMPFLRHAVLLYAAIHQMELEFKDRRHWENPVRYYEIMVSMKPLYGWGLPSYNAISLSRICSDLEIFDRYFKNPSEWTAEKLFLALCLPAFYECERCTEHGPNFRIHVERLERIFEGVYVTHSH